MATATIEKLRTETVISKVDSLIITPQEGRVEIDTFRDELEIAI